MPHFRQGLFTVGLLLVLLGVMGAAPRSTSPLAPPLVDADALLKAQRTIAWREGDTRYLLLERDVSVAVGAFGFRAERAVVRIDDEQRPGRRIHHLAIYLENAEHLHGRGPVTAEGPRLLVTASTTGNIALETDLLRQADAAPDVDLVQAAARRYQRHDAALAQALLPGPDEPLIDPRVDQLREARRSAIRRQHATRQVALPEALREPAAEAEAAPTTPPSEPAPPADERVADAEPDADRDGAPDDEVEVEPRPGVLPAQGVVTFNADRIVFDRGERDSALMLIGDVRFFWRSAGDTDADDPARQVALQAERAVIFLDPAVADAAAGRQLGAETVRGVYLEDNVVVTDGEFTVRAPRVYYDLTLDKAILLEGVLYTWDVRQQIPLYLRADVLRQTSASSFAAEDAILTTSAFAEPHLAIGASRITIEELVPADDDDAAAHDAEDETRITVRDATVQVAGVPVFYWPYLAGQTADIPLRAVGVGYSDQNGVEVRTRWDVFALTGRPRPDGVELTGALDYLGDHGPAIGGELEYERELMFGDLDAYFLPIDNGTDDIGGRRDIEQDDETRGFVHWLHRHDLQNDWELSLEAAYVSDETFLEEFFRDEAYESRSYETSLYLKNQEYNEALDLWVSTQLNDFTPQLTTLQAPGYTVERLPELGYFRVGESLWDGRLTWFSENRLGGVRASFGEDSPEDRGFTDAAAQEIFGIAATTSFEDAADAAGFPTDWRARLDTRQEITAPMKAGIFDVTPYVVGRLTAYGEDFDEFSNEDEQARLWGAVGTRLSTQFHREYPGVESRLFDLHRLRHVVEPHVDLFLMGSTFDPDDLPTYDPNVEALAEGAGVRLGLTQIFQTQRGGPGRWRSVDWLTLETDLVLRSDDADLDTEIARFYPYRPEFSLGGDHFYTQLLWLVTDTLGVSGELTHSLEEDQVAQWRVGLTLDHSPDLASFLYYQEIDVLDSRLLTYGFTYRLTTKYTMGFSQQLDFGENESRDINLWLERRLPSWRLRVVASFDELEDEQTVGVVLVPEGLGATTPGGLFTTR